MKLRIFLSLLILSLPQVCRAEHTLSVQQEYNSVLSAYQKKEWEDVITHTKVMIKEFPDSTFLSEIYYLAGVAYFQKGDCDLSNYYFSEFLEKYATPKYFEDALVYKFKIAERLESGAGMHMFGWEKMPRWASGYDQALDLYDEVIKTLPRHEITASALSHKARMLVSRLKYKEAIECYQTLIRRFPKNPLAPEAYLSIAEVYLKQTEDHYPDRDYLEQAKINLRKFRYDFPREERVIKAESLLGEMQDQYAKDLWDSAEYFYRKRKLPSAVLYYQSILHKYPQSHFAQEAIGRLALLAEKHPELINDAKSETEVNS